MCRFDFEYDEYLNARIFDPSLMLLSSTPRRKLTGAKHCDLFLESLSTDHPRSPLARETPSYNLLPATIHSSLPTFIYDLDLVPSNKPRSRGCVVVAHLIQYPKSLFSLT